jgi:WD40 repeat protein
VVGTLADARLITTSKGTAEIAHEALISEWPRLREWLEASRADLHDQRALGRAAREWSSADRDPSFLLRGTRLDHFAEWAPTAGLALSSDEQDYLAASMADRDARRTAQAREQADRERLRRRILQGLAVGFLIALILTTLALWQWNVATKAQTAAENAQTVAEHEARNAVIRELSAAALNNLAIDPELSVLLALEAVAQTREIDGTVTAEAEQALHQAVQASHVQLSIPADGSLGPASFSPDGSKIAAPADDGIIKLWDAVTGEELLSLPLESYRLIFRLFFNPNGTQLAAVSWREQGGLVDITIWDLATGQEHLHFEKKFNLSPPPLAFSQDGSRFVIGEDNYIGIYSTVSGELLHNLTSRIPFTEFAFSPDGTRLAAAGRGTYPTTQVWDLETKNISLSLKGHNGYIRGLIFSPDGALLATNGRDRQVIIWDARTGQQLRIFTGAKGYNNLHLDFGRKTGFSSDGKRLAMLNTQGQIVIWNLETGAEAYRFTCVPFPVDIHFNPDFSRVIATGPAGPPKICETSPDHEAFVTTKHLDEIWGVAFNPQGTLLVTGGQEKTGGQQRDDLLVWDLSGLSDGRAVGDQPYRSLPGQSPAAFSPDGTRIFAANLGGEPQEWELESGEELRYWEGGFIQSISYSPDEMILLTGDDNGNATMYDLEAGRWLYTLKASPTAVTAARFSPDGERFAIAGVNTPIKLWDTDTADELLTLEVGQNNWDIAFSPDGEYLAAGTADGQVLIWDAHTGGEPVVQGSGDFGQIMGIAYTPDGKRLVTGGFSGQVGVWDAENGQRYFTLASLPNAVLDVDISDDGRYLATGSEDGTVRVFLLDIDELIALAQIRVTRGFTQEECQQYLHMGICPERP